MAAQVQQERIIVLMMTRMPFQMPFQVCKQAANEQPKSSIDIDVEGLLHECALQGDYSPFPNKISALLYCLLNSPKPIVSIT